MKLLLIVFDGLGDRPLATLGHKTPLEAARKETLDKFAKEGICGLMDPLTPGLPAGSDTGHLALFGYDPREVYTGRGPFEAVGIGMEVKPGDVAFRVNLATVKGGKVLDRRAGRIKEGTDKLLAPLSGMKIGGVTCFIKPSVEHRAALVLCGKGLGDRVTDLDPHKEGKPVVPARGLDKASEKTARVLNAFLERSQKVLARHEVNRAREKKGELPANTLLIRGGGRAPQIPLFFEKTGLRGACIAETGLVRGVASYVGLQNFTPEGATGGVDSDCQSLVTQALAILPRFDFILLNYKAPDVAGHDGKEELKKKLIEKMDRALKPLWKEAQKGDLVVAITGDHSTPCALQEHSGDPLPLLIFGPGVRKDEVTSFGERSCAKGGLLRIKGNEVLPILLDLAGRQEKFGA